MCDCHPWSEADRKAWNRVKHEPRTREDWADLHDTIEQYRRRVLARHRGEAAEHGEGMCPTGRSETPEDQPTTASPRAE